MTESSDYIYNEDLEYLELFTTREHKLGGTSERFVLYKGKEKLIEIPARHIKIVVLYGNINITWKAINLLEKFKITLLKVNATGDPSLVIGNNLEYLDRKALKGLFALNIVDQNDKLNIAKKLIEAKIQSQSNLVFRKYRATLKKNLKELSARIREALEKIEKVSTLSELLGIEGMASKHYFKAIQETIPPFYNVNERSTKRHPTDPFNAALNYAYGILRKMILRELTAQGIPPITGIIHSEERIKTPLVFDLMEPLRPFIDLYTVNLFTNKQIKNKHYKETDNKVTLTKTGRKLILEHLSKKMREKQNITLRTSNNKDTRIKTDMTTAVRILTTTLKQSLKNRKQNITIPILPR